MTYSYNNKNNNTTLSAESVAAYLASNPDFFIQNESVLKVLNIPHGVQGNVQSLIERQVNLLREENTRLERMLDRNEELGKSHRYLQQHVYHFTFELLKCESINDLYRLLCLSLGKWFAASRVKLFIFNTDTKIEHIGGIHFLGNESSIRFMFTELLNRNKPLCTSLQTEQLQILFNTDTDKIKSNLLIPIKQEGWNGLFILGSFERNQYSYGEELDMLVYLSEMVSFKIGQLQHS